MKPSFVRQLHRKVMQPFFPYVGQLTQAVMEGLSPAGRFREGSVVTVTELICHMRGHVVVL
jgi:hypothetical protein